MYKKKPAPPDAHYVYVLVRTDLPQPHIPVQVAHAAMASALTFGDVKKPHPHLVVCSVPDEASLNAEFNRLKDAGVPCCGWMEDDMGNALTAVATAPLHGDARRELRRHPLLR